MARLYMLFGAKVDSGAQGVGTVEEAIVGGTSMPERVKMPRKWMVAMASTETGNHMAFTSANCTVM